MFARSGMIAAAAMLVCASAAAQPVKTAEADGAKPSSRPAPVVLASADHVPGTMPTPDSGAVPPKRPRAARVTTCRCGGDPQPDQREEQQ
jgi:hypothetical protein